MRFLLSFVSVLFICSISSAAGNAVADVSLTPAGSFKAKCDDVQGFAVVKGDLVKADNVIVNMKSLSTGLSLRDKHAKDKYLEVDKYPQLILVHGEGKGGHGKGRVKYRGVEREIAGTYTVKGDKVIAEFPMKLSEYNISGIRYMGVGVSDEVKIAVEVPIKK